MNKVFLTSLKMDYYSAINCFIYYLNKIKILDNMFHPLYKKNGFKLFITLLASLITFLKRVISKSIYVFLIYFISKNISNNTLMTFIHIYFIFSIIGMFINTKLLNIGYKHYICTCMLHMDTKKYLLSHLIFELITNLLIDVLVLSPLLNHNIFIILLLLFSLFSKTVGELINLKYYQTNHSYLIDNYILYFSILIILLGISILPYFNIFIEDNIYIIITSIFSILFLYSIYRLFKFNDYRVIVREIINSRVLNQTQDKDRLYLKLEDNKVEDYENKTIYQKINNIFYKRHKNILLKTVSSISLIIVVASIIFICYLINNNNLLDITYSFIKENLVLLIPIMYFINQGALITQIMFVNSDKALLRYRFYRNYDVITNMFKERLKIVIKINLIPALVISIMLVIIINICKPISILYMIILILYILILSVLFSIHYLTMYYLYQPYNEDTKIVSIGYLMANFIITMICFILIAFSTEISIGILLLVVIIITTLYIFISNLLVSRRGSYTFRIK